VPKDHSPIQQHSRQEHYPFQLKIGQRLALTTSILLILAMCTFWLVSNKTTESILRQQADSLGTSLARQTSILVTELVLANDLISMNVLLNQLTREAAVAQAAILSIDDQIIAISDSSIAGGPDRASGQTDLFGSYVAPIALQDSLAGYVRINLDQRYIEQGVTRNFLFLLAALTLLIATAVSVSFALAQYYISLPLASLRVSIRQLRGGEVSPASFGERGDEVGAVVRQYNRLLYELEDPALRREIFAEDEADITSQANSPGLYRRPGSTFVSILSINISNYLEVLESQDDIDTVELLNTFYFYVHKVSDLYNGNVEACTGDDILITFGASKSDEDHSFQAICAALLFLEIASTIGRELAAQALVAPQFKAGLHCGELLTGILSSLDRQHYTVAGGNVDLSRLICAKAESGELVISDDAYHQADADDRLIASKLSEMQAANSRSPTQIWRIEEPMDNYKALLHRQVEHLLSQEIPN
jgi:uncharacterized membrane protein affecting hemolysin expression/class 3 adenylate cyclase